MKEETRTVVEMLLVFVAFLVVSYVGYVAMGGK